jgi:hypothetical protein
MKRIRCPGLVDVTLEDRPLAIRAASTDPELDRGYRKCRPVLNRLRVRDVLRTLQIGRSGAPPLA